MAGMTLEKMLAKAEIEEVMLRWCRAVDRCDWESVPDLFHPEGYDNHGIFRGDVAGMIAWLSERHKSVTRSMHMITNMRIEFADDDNALVETYSLAVQRYPAGGSQATRAAIAGGGDTGDGSFDMMITGRYVDHFQKRDGTWRILNRTVVFDNSVLLPVNDAGGSQLGADWAISTRGKDDPIWELRRAVGL